MPLSASGGIKFAPGEFPQGGFIPPEDVPSALGAPAKRALPGSAGAGAYQRAEELAGGEAGLLISFLGKKEARKLWAKLRFASPRKIKIQAEAADFVASACFFFLSDSSPCKPSPGGAPSYAARPAFPWGKAAPQSRMGEPCRNPCPGRTARPRADPPLPIISRPPVLRPVFPPDTSLRPPAGRRTEDSWPG